MAQQSYKDLPIDTHGRQNHTGSASTANQPQLSRGKTREAYNQDEKKYRYDYFHYLVICDVNPIQASRLFAPILCCLADDTNQDDDPFESWARRKRQKDEQEKQEDEKCGDPWYY